MAKRRKKDVPDPSANYREWTKHSLDPGYYLGAKTPPDLRIWSRKDRKWLGSTFVAVSAAGFLLAISKTRDPTDLVFVALFLVPLFIPGLIMLFARSQKR